MAPASERRMNVLVVSAVLASIPLGALAFLAGVSAGAAQRDSVDCDEWTFDRERWDENPRGTADALVDCEALLGLSEGEVRDMLGRPIDTGARWTYPAGAANDYMGPGDANSLFVQFTPQGEVRGARLLHEGERATAID